MYRFADLCARLGSPAACLATILLTCPVVAHESHTPSLEEIIVYGRAQPLIGQTRSASEGLVALDDLRLPPLLRVGELVEAVPGMVATQHSGTGKANQYFLRGFNLDHGTDFAATLDGVPLNMRTHGHGQGYLDLNFMIPELVTTTWYRKGPYHATVGDFSSAGSVDFQYADRARQNQALLSGGQNGYARALAIVGTDTAGGNSWLGAVDVTHYDGPWVLNEDSRANRAYASRRATYGSVETRLALHAYDARWNSTDQIPERAVASGLINRRGNIDPDLGGATSRYALTADFRTDAWQVTAYTVDYRFRLLSNFTYFLEDPVNGDQFLQGDRRRIHGMTVRSANDFDWGERRLETRWGADLRLDDIRRLELSHTLAGASIDPIRADSVAEGSLGLFGDMDLALMDALTLHAGLRLDGYRWDVSALQPANGGDGSDAQWSPNRLTWRVADNLAAFVNFGRGMHSNDVRGATIRTDPLTGDAVDPVPALVASTGSEIGLRFERGRTFNLSLALFALRLDSELVFVGDAGTTETNTGSQRLGGEVTLFWQPLDWLAMHAAWTRTRARLRDTEDAQDHIPGAIESTFNLGVDASWRNGLSASLKLRHLGPASLVEDDSVRAASSTLVNLGLAWRYRAVEYRLDAFNLLDSRDHDISYFYTSRLASEPADGMDDVHFHPLEPRTWRASVTLYF
ncbi:MAG: TonB-dependent receptor [Pseudomonadales bacterium]